MLLNWPKKPFASLSRKNENVVPFGNRDTPDAVWRKKIYGFTYY